MIIVSGWTWEAYNVPERMASAFARAGSKVLYCENPSSFLRSARTLSEVESNVFAFGLQHLSHRLNSFPILRQLQANMLAQEILEKASRLRLNDPVFIYPHGDYCLPLCRQFRRRGFQLIHVCMDYEFDILRDHVRESHFALVIPEAAFQELRKEFGAKIRKIPQLSNFQQAMKLPRHGIIPKPEFYSVDGPRLGYLGRLTGRVSLPLLKATLSLRPELNFFSCEERKQFELKNEHALGWRSQEELAIVLSGLDAGLMLYDCAIPKNLHCVPLKLFDYFARGMPVVSTPIAFLKDHQDLVYVGSTPAELSSAISLALLEPIESLNRARRIALAEQHSIEHCAQVLGAFLEEVSEGWISR